MKKAVLICCLVTCSTRLGAFAQAISAAEIDHIHSEIESVHAREQAAFISGDCEAVATYYAEEGTFYANGRVIPSLEALVNLCRRIPRPFEQDGALRDSIRVLSETAGHSVRVIELAPEDAVTDRFSREVVTKVWLKGPEGWKIVHFHSSISVLVKQ